jgi:hypothetical protein
MAFRIGLAVLAGVAGLATGVPAPAAVTLTDGQAVPGLEPTPGEGHWRPEAADTDRPAEEWFWYRVSARGLPEEASEPMPLAVADLAELIVTEFQVVSAEADAAVTVSEMETLMQAAGAGRSGGAAEESWPADVPDRQDLTRIGMRVGRADGGPTGWKKTAPSLAGGGRVMGRLVRRRRI